MNRSAYDVFERTIMHSYSQALPFLAIATTAVMTGDVEILYADPEVAVCRFARERAFFQEPKRCSCRGYASGKVVQFEIEAANGDRFMASEQELQPQ